MILEVFVGKHGLCRDCIIGDTEIGRFSKIAKHVFKILEVVVWDTLQDVLLVVSATNLDSVECGPLNLRQTYEARYTLPSGPGLSWRSRSTIYRRPDWPTARVIAVMVYDQN